MTNIKIQGQVPEGESVKQNLGTKGKFSIICFTHPWKECFSQSEPLVCSCRAPEEYCANAARGWTGTVLQQ